jgi:hypothetical protein
MAGVAQITLACHGADFGLNYGEQTFWNLFRARTMKKHC